MSLPITRAQAHTAAKWMKDNFGRKIQSAVANTPFSVDLLCGIACQETAYFWLNFVKKISPAEIVARCVLDASGDFPDTHRSAFPKNTAAFRRAYGDEFTDMLIAEANATRKLRGFGPQKWVYKGYGIFQYDLQAVKEDERFFKERRWHDFDASLGMAMGELKEKYKIDKNVWSAVRRYNGSGAAATRYANNVIQFAKYCSEVS
jgi:hypothetical protein